MLNSSESKPTRLIRSQSNDIQQESDTRFSYRRSQSYSPLTFKQALSDHDDIESSSLHADTTSYATLQSKRASWICLGVLLIACMSGYAARQSIQSTAARVSAMETSRQLLKEKVTSVANDLVELKKKITSINSNPQHDHNQEKEEMKVSNIRAMHQMNKAQKRVDTASKQALLLRERVQALSLAGISKKYGDGIHHVEFELEFQDGVDGPTKFVIELAPSELMPHSVETFLDMVSNKLVDGCSFIMNALNLIKAAPLPYDGSSAKDKAQSFADFGLDKLAFKEYSESFPHEKYTMGFTADGSPSFFINVDDNTHSHEGDPCFAKVIQGFDAVKRLESSPTRNGIWFTQRVGIKSARIIEANSINYEQAKLRQKSRA
jgi:cyclophilin family peptidyl-prolyl cis-trans isomerase